MSMSNIVISDVPELKNEKTVKTILDLIVSIKVFSVAQSIDPHIISASQVRKEIKKRLEKDVKGNKKYDLIFLCESGGMILCEGFKDKLTDVGNEISILPYSEHGAADWERIIADKMEQLNEKARVAIIEGDVGEIGSTSGKLNTAVHLILQTKPDTYIHVVAGAANSHAFKRLPLLKTVKLSCCWKTKGQVSRFSELIRRLKNHLDTYHQTGSAKEQYMTERELDILEKGTARLEQILTKHNLYKPKGKSDR